MKLSKLGQILGIVGQGALTVGKFTPVGAGITTGLNIAGAALGGLAKDPVTGQPAPVPTNPDGGLNADFNRDGVVTAKELAVVLVIQNANSIVPQIIAKDGLSVKGGLALVAAGIEEWLKSAEVDIGKEAEAIKQAGTSA